MKMFTYRFTSKAAARVYKGAAEGADWTVSHPWHADESIRQNGTVIPSAWSVTTNCPYDSFGGAQALR